MAETEAAEARFARVDALIADAEARSEPFDTPDEPHVDSLTEDERRDIDEAMRLVHGVGEASPPGRGEVA